MTTTKEFKGKAGGDPSRMPPMVDVEWSCKHCNKVSIIQTRRPKGLTFPDYCSPVCEDLSLEVLARKMVKTRLGETLPEAHLLRSGIFRSVVKYGKLLERAEINISLVVRTHAICPHCKKNGAHFCDAKEKPSEKASFCSADCAQSSKAHLSEGVICANPRKRRFDSESEAREAVIAANDALVGEGEERMEHYVCICGKWHFGHVSKAVAEDKAMSARNALKTALDRMFDEESALKAA